jgi:hypothetical protein
MHQKNLDPFWRSLAASYQSTLKPRKTALKKPHLRSIAFSLFLFSFYTRNRPLTSLSFSFTPATQEKNTPKQTHHKTNRLPSPLSSLPMAVNLPPMVCNLPPLPNWHNDSPFFTIIPWHQPPDNNSITNAPTSSLQINNLIFPKTSSNRQHHHPKLDHHLPPFQPATTPLNSFSDGLITSV